jgi:hypothetical protein
MNNKLLKVVRSSLVCLMLPGLALAQHDAGIPQIEDIEGLHPGKAYSPYAQRAFPSQLYWVLLQEVSIANSGQVFDEDGAMPDPALEERLLSLGRQLVKFASMQQEVQQS